MPHIITTDLAKILEFNKPNLCDAHDILSLIHDADYPVNAEGDYQLALIATNTFNPNLPQQRVGLVVSSGELVVLNHGKLERYYAINDTIEGTFDTLLQILYESVHEQSLSQAERRMEWSEDDVLQLMDIIRVLSDKMSVYYFSQFVEPYLNYIPMDVLFMLGAEEKQDSEGNSLLTLPQESLQSKDGMPMAFSLVDGELTFGSDVFYSINEPDDA